MKERILNTHLKMIKKKEFSFEGRRRRHEKAVEKSYHDWRIILKELASLVGSGRRTTKRKGWFGNLHSKQFQG